MKTIYTFLLILPLCIICSTVYSQQEHLITLNPSKIQLDNKQFFIAQVLDKRVKKTDIGAVLSGTKIVKANFSNPFTEELHRAFDIMAPYIFSSIPLTVVINSFAIQEHTEAGDNVGTTTLELEVFNYQDTLTSLAKIHTKKSKIAGNVTRKHPKIILEALEDCLQQINKIRLDTQQIVQDFEFSLDNIKEGIYSSASAFFTNRPIEDGGFRMKNRNVSGKYDRYELEYNDKNRPITDVFVVYNNGKIYLNSVQYSATSKKPKNSFVKAELTGVYIYFEDRVSKLKGSSAVVAGVAGGIVGGLVGGGAIGLASMQKTGILLDTKNKELLLLTLDNLVELTNDYPKIREKYNESKRKIADKKQVIKDLNQVLATQMFEN